MVIACGKIKNKTCRMKSSEKSIIAVSLFFATIFLIAVVVYFLFDSKVFFPRMGTRLTHQELRNNLFNFNKSAFFEKDELSFLLRCKHGRCEGEGTVSNSLLAWSMLFLARGIENHRGAESGDSESDELKFLENKLDHVLEKWISSVDLESEVYSVYSLHQLYEAGEVLDDKRFYLWVYEKDKVVVDFLSSNFIEGYPYSFTNSFLLLTGARQLFLKPLLELKKINPHETPREFPEELQEMLNSRLATFETLLSLAAYDQRKGYDSKAPLLFDTKDGFSSQSYCFVPWAQSKAIEAELALGRKIEDTKYFNNVISSLNKFSELLSRDKANFEFLQSVLPCLHTTRELKKLLRSGADTRGGEFKNRSEKTIAFLDKLYLQLIQDYIIPFGNGNCDHSFSGGFFSYSGDHLPAARSCYREFSFVDNSWLYFVLDRDLDHEVFFGQ